MRLNVKRRSNADIRDQIQLAIVETESAIEAFHAAADEDIAILDELLVAHRAARSGQGQEGYLAALARAADSPLRMGEQIAALLDTIAGQVPISTRFTVSDLGAAAVLAEGACRAALLTAEVNIALLAGTEGADPEVADVLDRRRAAIIADVVDKAEAIESETRVVMRGSRTGESDR
jgi:formiminotetrahydrofolate cyclodeaminase